MQKSEKSGSGILKKVLFGVTALAVVACIAIFITYFLNDRAQKKNLFMTDIAGSVTVEGKAAVNKDAISSGKKIITGVDSSCTLYYSDEVLLRILPDSEMIIKDISLDGSVRNYNLVLVKGKLSADFNNAKKSFTYLIQTPKAEITSIGTKFTLTADGTKTLLEVTEGSVNLKSTDSGETVTAPEGKSYTVTEKITEGIVPDAPPVQEIAAPATKQAPASAVKEKTGKDKKSKTKKATTTKTVEKSKAKKSKATKSKSSKTKDKKKSKSKKE